MRSVNDPHPVVQIAIGLALGLVCIGIPWACTSTHQLTPELACRLRALDTLPDDYGQLTVYDAIAIYERVRACAPPAIVDGGL